MEIKQEFKNLMPPLKEAEYSELESSILAEGCREPLIVWNNILVDGHHRYEICTKHNIPFKVINKDFEDENEAMLWIINNQLGRRNITDFARAELVLKKKDILLEKGREKQKQTLGGYKYNKPSVLANSAKTDTPHNTREILAKEIGVGQRTIGRVEVILREAPEEVKDKLRRGDITINKVYTEIQNKKRAQQKTPELPTGKYRVIYADPAWQYKNSGFTTSAENHYKTMPTDEICNLPIKDLADENAVLFLWATNPLLEDALRVCKAWGFTYKTNFVWIKNQHTGGFYNYGQHELLFVATKGSMLPKLGSLHSSVINSIRREHSRKPDEIYDIIEAMYDAPYLELFARTERKNWTGWGLEYGIF